METRIIDDKKEWNDWLLKHNGPFTQSWEWGDVLVREGKKVERIAVVEGQRILAEAQVVFTEFLGLKFAFAPKGPVFIKEASYEERESISEVIKYLKDKKIIFFRTEPATLQSLAGHESQKSIDINPRATTRLDLEKPLEELRKRMHPKTRYNINLAEKKLVTVKQTKNLELFMGLMKETGKRDDFRLHEKKHYEEIINSGTVRQLNASVGDNIIASIVLIGFGNTMTYLFGASKYDFRQYMAPHLLQWEGIRLAKELGYKYYDFFGIAPRIGDSEYEYDPDHQYAGVTRFKIGFGGEICEEPGTFDLIISGKKYNIYEVLRRLRRLV